MAYFLIGFSVGALVMWCHFTLNGLIRTREEWENYRNLKAAMRKEQLEQEHHDNP